jgi:sugar-specific transcriptional regulator TrmB
MIALGLSEYEAKAYVALIKVHPATAYEISRESGIPSSKIYETIARLVEKKIFLPVVEQEKNKYVPVPPEEFVESRKSYFNETLDDLNATLPGLTRSEGASFIWNVYEYEYLMDKARRMVQSAEKEVMVSLWREEFTGLKAVLKKADARGVKVAVVHFGIPDKIIGQLFQHPIEDTLYDEKGGRGFTLVCDGKTALVATISEDLHVEGAWSHNLGFVTLAEDFIKHDIYIMKIVKRFDPHLKHTFGKNYRHLRDIFEDREET